MVTWQKLVSSGMGQACSAVEIGKEEDFEITKALLSEKYNGNRSSSHIAQQYLITVVSVTEHHAKYKEDSSLAERITTMINSAFAAPIQDLLDPREPDPARVTLREIQHRLASSDVDEGSKNVFHLAFHQDKLVGCVSSSYQPQWTEKGCGLWGLLAVDRAFQGFGVASELVRVAETCLFEGGCSEVQIEYEYVEGHPYYERLRAWFESKLQFECISGWLVNRAAGMVLARQGAEFRRCRKKLVKPYETHI